MHPDNWCSLTMTLQWSATGEWWGEGGSATGEWWGEGESATVSGGGREGVLLVSGGKREERGKEYIWHLISPPDNSAIL